MNLLTNKPTRPWRPTWDKYSQSVLYPSPYQSQARIPKWLRQLTLQLKVLVSLSTLILGVKTLYITFEETFYTYFRWQILFDGGKVWYSQFPKQTCILLCVLYHYKRYQWTKLSQISTHPRATQQDCVKCRRHFTIPAVPTQEAILEEGGSWKRVPKSKSGRFCRIFAKDGGAP